MVIQAKVLCYNDVKCDEQIDTCVICTDKENNECFSAVVKKIENYYGKNLMGFMEMKILSYNDFLAVRGSHEFFSEGDIRI